MTIPTCHNCGSAALPFQVALVGARWSHACGAVVCPACGNQVADEDFLCNGCHALAGALPIQPGDVVRVESLVSIGTPIGAIIADGRIIYERPHGR